MVERKVACLLCHKTFTPAQLILRTENPETALCEVSGLYHNFGESETDAQRIERTLATEYAGEEIGTVVVLALADIRKLCDAHGLDFGALDGEAHDIYLRERFGEKESDKPSYDSEMHQGGAAHQNDLATDRVGRREDY